MKQENADRLLEIIKPTLDQYALTYEIETSEYPSEGPVRAIKITDPINPYFSINIYGDGYRTDGKYEFCVNSSHTRHWETHDKYSDGSKRTESNNYDYEYLLSNEEHQSLGIEKEQYNYSLRSLNKVLKNDKNPKLILKNFLAVLEPYHRAIQLLTPRLNEKIAREIEILRLRNEFERSTCNWLSNGLSRERDIRVGKYRFKFSSHDSDPEVSYAMPYADALALAIKETEETKETNK